MNISVAVVLCKFSLFQPLMLFGEAQRQRALGIEIGMGFNMRIRII